MNISNILNLFKYDPATQGALTFNIEQALNQNWDKIVALLGKVLMSYDEKITYAENDLCTSGGKVYQSKVSSNTGNALTNTTYWKDLNNATDTEITTLNEALSQEISNRQNADAQKLPLTGGTLSGNLEISKSGGADVQLTDASQNSMFMLLCQNAFAVMRNGSISGSGYMDLQLGSSSSELTNKLRLFNSAGSTAYKIYGEHNITVSTAAPTGTLAEGAQHQVYA